jgi:DNA polymerase delta subunit 1
MDALPKRKASAPAAAAKPAKPRARGAVHDEPTQASAPAHEEAAAQHVDFFITDIECAKEEDAGAGAGGGSSGFLVWGVTHDAARTLCVRVADFAHGFYARAPTASANGNAGGGGALTAAHLDAIRAALAARAGVERGAVRVELCHKTPIMYFRPASAGPAPFLRLGLVDGTRPGRLAAAAARVAADEDGALAAHGLSWRQYEAFEDDVKPLARFLADSELCGGGWARLRLRSGDGADDALPCARPLPAEHPQRLSRCALEFAAPWRALTALTPDAAQLADAAHAAQLAALLAGGGPAAHAAAAGKLPPLRCCFLSVTLACLPGNGNGNGGGKAAAAPAPLPTRTPNASTDPIVALSCVLAPLPHGGAPLRPTAALHFTWCAPGSGSSGGTDGDEGVGYAPPGVSLCAFSSERAMITAFSRWLVEEADPDIVAVFQVFDSIAALLTRAEKLRMPPLALGRHARRAASVKSNVMYTASWVKAQQRMAATSNQECFKASLGGRLVFDVLRQVLTSHSMGTFTLADCALSLLCQTLEVLPPEGLAALCAGRAGGRTRLARYSLRRAHVVGELMSKLESITEAVEMARTCGITVPIVAYQAQMVRTHSLLLRAARRAGYVLGGKMEAVSLSESPFLMHPVEAHTAGLYARDPVAVLDFASLYPSIFRAHNLCYTTLLHPSDAPGAPGAALREEDVFRSPSGAAFVRPHVRAGVFPALLGALLAARAAAKDALQRETDAERRAVLELRQKSLKLVANAAYGFTGAAASPLQSAQLADTCLALGAASCRAAIEALHGAAELRGARVIYAQTDSMFLCCRGASDDDALRLGARAAAIVTACFPQAMSVKLERCMRPFLLLQVNRYAGRQFSAAADDPGTLHFKGIKAAWRQSAPFLRRLLTRCLELMLVQQNTPAAVEHACAEIRRLLSGGVDIGELVMTGGLWRHTSKDIARAAAAEAGEAEVTGPHAALAVRLAARDPGRVRVLGERVPYVLLAGGHKKQDDAAEDPVVALRSRGAPNVELYWSNKVAPPLQEIFAHALPPEALRELLTGPHTRVKAGALLRDSASGAPARGLGGFFAPRARCLCCRQALPPATPPPPLCEACGATRGRDADTMVRLTDASNAAEARGAAGDAACMRCHSGGLFADIVCANGDCPVLFARGKAASDAAEARDALARFDDW